MIQPNPPKGSATYRAHTNIALIKYWGKRDQALFLPVTSSLSLTLDAFYTDTQVTFDAQLAHDRFILDGQEQEANQVAKVSAFLDRFRALAKTDCRALVTSTNHVPTAAGLASSASAYAALACATNAALGLDLSQRQLSILARQGSGSASRSLFGGFVIWHAGQGEDSDSSYAEPFEAAEWDLAMLVVMVNKGTKKISSRQGMALTMETSPFYALWPDEVAKDLAAIQPAILAHDLDRVGQIAEHNAMKMHATMIAANPSFSYWEAASLKAMDLVRQLRQEGFTAYFTMDAGPNVKVLCPASQAEAIRNRFMTEFDSKQLAVAYPGPAPYPIND